MLDYPGETQQEQRQHSLNREKNVTTMWGLEPCTNTGVLKRNQRAPRSVKAGPERKEVDITGQDFLT